MAIVINTRTGQVKEDVGDVWANRLVKHSPIHELGKPEDVDAPAVIEEQVTGEEKNPGVFNESDPASEKKSEEQPKQQGEPVPDKPKTRRRTRKTPASK